MHSEVLVAQIRFVDVLHAALQVGDLRAQARCLSCACDQAADRPKPGTESIASFGIMVKPRKPSVLTARKHDIVVQPRRSPPKMGV